MLVRNLLCATICLLVLTACGGGGGDSAAPAPSPQPSQFRVGGTIAGLNGSVGLQLNRGGTLTVSSNGPFTFDEHLSSGASYQVIITSQPAGQQCEVTSGTGLVSADVSTIRVDCNSFPQLLTTTVSGLTGAVLVQLNGTETQLFTNNGTYTFPSALQQGASYQLTITQQPTGQECSLGAASGIVGPVAPNVTLTCYPAYRVGVSFSGVRGDLVLQNNGGDDRTISSPLGTSSGSAYFARGLRSGASYNITIRTQPNGQHCTLTGGQGTVGDSDNPAAATIACETIVPTYTVGGTVTGLHGQLRLRNNGIDPLSLTTSGPFTMGSLLIQGDSFNVTIESQPPTQQCAVTGGSGTIANSNITSLAVSCVDLTPHRLEGRAIGVTSDIVLRNGGEDPLTLGSEGDFSFMTPLYPGMEYDVTVTSANPAQRCHVARGTGTMPDAHVDDIRVTCSSKRATRFAYVVNEGDYGPGGSIVGAGISQFVVGSDGWLTPLDPATVNAGVRPGAITVDPSGRFVYVRSSDGATPATLSYWQFAITSSGALTPLSTPSVSTSGTTGHLVINRDTTYAYAARGADILRFPINADGTLAAPIAQTLAVAGSFRSIAFDRAGEHAYVTGDDAGGNGVIYQFEVQGDGAFTAMTPASVDGNVPFVNFIESEPLDRFVYSVDGGFSRLVQFRRTDQATLAPLDPSSLYNATTFPWLLKTDPFGEAMYVAAPGSIASFIIGSTGTLSPGTPERVLAPTGSFTAFALDLAGAYVYATAGNFVHVYQTAANGALTHIDAATIATGSRPVAMAVSP